MKAVREGIAPEAAERAGQALRGLLGSFDGPLMVYVSIGTELPTRALIAALLAEGHPIAVPRITGPRTMEPRRLDALDALIPGRFRVPTSDGPPIEVAHVLVPGLAFDARGGRLGYGAGFYDRWLAANDVRSIGLGYRAQIVDEVPLEPHDRPLDAVLTETGWVHGGPGYPP